jgi:hypothetical protein
LQCSLVWIFQIGAHVIEKQVVESIPMTLLVKGDEKEIGLFK